jgi:hypothetical protein
MLVETFPKQVISVNSWFWNGGLEDRKAAYAAGKKAMDFLREITPDSAAYSVRVFLSFCTILLTLSTERIRCL